MRVGSFGDNLAVFFDGLNGNSHLHRNLFIAEILASPLQGFDLPGREAQVGIIFRLPHMHPVNHPRVKHEATSPVDGAYLGTG